MSESSIRIIVFATSVYPYLELYIEQDKLPRALLIKHKTERTEWFYSFLLIRSILE